MSHETTTLHSPHPARDAAGKAGRVHGFPMDWVERRRMAVIQQLVDERDGMRIAEIGSAGGEVLRMFTRSKLTAIDVSSRFLDVARANLAGYDVTFVHGDPVGLEPLPTGFDRVICADVIEHTLDPRALLLAIARMLAPGGRAILTVPNDPFIQQLLLVMRCGPAAWALRRRLPVRERHLHLHVWRPRQFRSLLEEFFDVDEYVASPSRLCPLRACFACRARA